MSDSPVPHPIPEGSILLHVGMHKTGTTALQNSFKAATADLADQGVFYPPTRSGLHHWTARSLLQQPMGWGEKPPPAQVWETFAETVRASDAARTLISSEYFGGATDEHCRRIADDLGADRLHVVVGARHVAGVAVSLWQQSLKLGRRSTLDEWLERNIRRPGDGGSTVFWDRQDPTVAAGRWVRILGPERVNVIVVDASDRTLLPATFEGLLGLRPGTLSDVDVVNVNRGLTAVEAEFLRRVNAEVRQELTWAEYARLVRYGAIRNLVLHRQPPRSEPRLAAPGWVREQAVVEGQRMIDAIRGWGVPVFGDLVHLAASDESSDAEALSPGDDAAIDLAADVLIGAVRRSVEESRQLADQVRRLRSPRVADQTARQLVREIAARAKRRLRGR